MPSTLVTQGERVDSGQQVFAGAEEDRADGEVHLVDESGLEVLPDRGDPTTEPNVPTVGGFPRPLQGDMGSFGYEVERRVARHGD